MKTAIKPKMETIALESPVFNFNRYRISASRRSIFICSVCRDVMLETAIGIRAILRDFNRAGLQKFYFDAAVADSSGEKIAVSPSIVAVPSAAPTFADIAPVPSING